MKTLDLHHRRYIDIRRLVIRFIEDNWGKPERLEIITGKSGQMQKLVGEVLDEYTLDYTIPLSNPGCIFVEMEET